MSIINKILDLFCGDEIVDAYFNTSNLYDHPDDYPGSQLMHDLSAHDDKCADLRPNKDIPIGKQTL